MILKDLIKIPVVTCAKRYVDDSLKYNAENASNTGLEVKVTRHYDGVGLSGGRTCEWCLDRCGENMSYSEAYAKGAFERHEGCNCMIDYTSAKGERSVQKTAGVWTKVADRKEIESRKQYGLDGLTENAVKTKLHGKEKHDRITVKGSLGFVNRPIDKTDNRSVREWYVEAVSTIPYQIDHRLPLEEQAKQALMLRNSYKRQARAAMSDEKTAECLNDRRPEPVFEALVQSKMKRKGLSREEALHDIIKTSSKTNEKVNKEFGL